MRIAQVAPLQESVPPRLYGGTERVVSYLTEELVKQGHDVALFASGDSRTAAQLNPMCREALRLNPECRDPLAHHLHMVEQVAKVAHSFDIVHFHIDYLHFPVSRRLGLPNLTTLHGRLDIPDLVPIFRTFRDMPLISISNDQRAPLSWANWHDTIYNGVPADYYHYRAAHGDYLAFLGRLSPEKRPDRAIEIAVRAGMDIKIAAKIDKVDVDYVETHIRPLLKHPRVEYLGEINEREKDEFLGNAYALLFPIDWQEPFGLAMIEALACGTPVIAWQRGSVPEVIQHGVTGYIVDDIDAAVSAVERIDRLSRAACRRIFEQDFSAARMAKDYVASYHRLLQGRQMSEEIPMLAS